jgi:hypothetical protein
MDRSAVRPGSTLRRRLEELRPGRDRTLFAPDATYRYHPYDRDAVEGRGAIVGTARNRTPGTYDAHYEPYAVDRDRAVATGTSRYWSDASKSTLDRVYDNVYLLAFDGDGRCTSFTEYFMQEPAAS